MTRKHLITLLTVIIISLPANLRGVDFMWNVDLSSVFDNREGDDDITAAKTYFFTKLAPEVGLKFSPKDRIAAGVVWFQPIGCQWEGHRLSPTVYYRREDKKWKFSMGMFPRKQLSEEMPGFLWNDSLSYSQNNIRGVLVQYISDKGYFDAYVDWRGMQTKSQREAFNIVFHGQMSPWRNLLNIGVYAQMNHYALQKDPPADQHIVDNFLVNPYIGVDLGKNVSTDSLTVRAGLLMTVERNRAIADAKWDTPAGFYLEAVGEWKWLGIKNTLYAGKPLFPSYNCPSPEFLDNKAPHATEQEIAQNPIVWSPMGPGLYQGEPYYQKKFYDRLNVYARILRTRHVNLTASLDFNFTPSSFIFYQRLMLQITLP